MNLQEQYAQTCQEFRAAIARIASIACKPELAVYQLWREYSQECSNSDQSALLWEFIDWYRPQLGGNAQALREAIESKAGVA